MIFERDKTKNRANVRNHGFDLADAEEMFRGVMFVDPDTREDYGEKRWVGLGVSGGLIVRGVRGTRPGNHSHHFMEKGKQS